MILSITSVPPRFAYLGEIARRLSVQSVDEIWINIPRQYNRFPGWDGSVPKELPVGGGKVRVNRVDRDYGPGTKFIGPALELDPEDLIIYLDDDTLYPPKKLASALLQSHHTEPTCAWGLSGFNFTDYFKGVYPRAHGMQVDVLEGYGGVVVKAGWVQAVLPEFMDLLQETWHDDMILCNLLEKSNIPRKTVCTAECNFTMVQQLQFGFAADALHHVAGGAHVENNKKILQNFQAAGREYYSYELL